MPIEPEPADYALKLLSVELSAATRDLNNVTDRIEEMKESIKKSEERAADLMTRRISLSGAINVLKAVHGTEVDDDLEEWW